MRFSAIKPAKMTLRDESDSFKTNTKELRAVFNLLTAEGFQRKPENEDSYSYGARKDETLVSIFGTRMTEKLFTFMNAEQTEAAQIEWQKFNTGIQTAKLFKGPLSLPRMPAPQPLAQYIASKKQQP